MFRPHWFVLKAKKTPWALFLLLLCCFLTVDSRLSLVSWLSILVLPRTAFLGLLIDLHLLTVAHGKIRTILCLDFVILIAEIGFWFCFWLFVFTIAFVFVFWVSCTLLSKLLIGSLSPGYFYLFFLFFLLFLLLPIKLFK